MQVTEGHVSRVFIIRLEDGEELPKAVEAVARKKTIRAGLVFLVGGARDGTLVVGPKKTTLAPVPMIQHFTGGHEILGIGTIFEGAKGPELHMHAALGRGKATRAGCIRKGIRTYLIGEVVIMELAGFRARRERDPKSGFHLLKIR